MALAPAAHDPVAQCDGSASVVGPLAATRVTPAHAWRQRRLPPTVWLLAQQNRGATPRTKYCLLHLPAPASLRSLVPLAHQGWAIEQQYPELKDELDLDHFEAERSRDGSGMSR